MPTSVIQEKGPPKTTPPCKEGIPLYHRSGDKPLDPTTLFLEPQPCFICSFRPFRPVPTRCPETARAKHLTPLAEAAAISSSLQVKQAKNMPRGFSKWDAA